jgi:CheY-like chemotaxis protein/anti-sigma regulatory factor (Ser/Thr protein kinase)
MHNAEFALEYANLSAIRQQVEDWVGRYNDKRLSGFVLITSEIITNLLKHSSPKATQCRIELAVETTGSTFKIYDNGGCFENFEEIKNAADKEFSEIQVSGMGLGLSNSLVDDFSYQPAANGQDQTEFNCYKFEMITSLQRTIAVIDDDVSILVLLEAYLEGQYRVLTFESGQLAIKGLAGKRVDLVISDLNMPELDGLQLRTALQTGLGDIPFIFLTGENSEKLHRVAIDDVLHKPITKQNLIQSVERVLIRHASLKESIGQQLSSAIVNQLTPRIKYQPNGYHILLASRAAKSGGGDFVFQKDQSSGCLILLADVMGHDQQAKFFVHAYQGFLQGMCHGLTDCSNSQTLLYALSEGLRSDDLLANSLLTAVSIFCAKDGDISISAAGHPAPKVLVDGLWNNSSVSGPLLGFSDKPEYETYKSPRGAPVLCFTDGLIENLSESEQQEFLARLTVSISQPNPSLSRAMDYYDNKAGVPAGDDMTLMVILPQENVSE